MRAHLLSLSYRGHLCTRARDRRRRVGECVCVRVCCGGDGRRRGRVRVGVAMWLPVGAGVRVEGRASSHTVPRAWRVEVALVVASGGAMKGGRVERRERGQRRRQRRRRRRGRRRAHERVRYDLDRASSCVALLSASKVPRTSAYRAPSHPRVGDASAPLVALPRARRRGRGQGVAGWCGRGAVEKRR
jgi:hypothetical protein